MADHKLTLGLDPASQITGYAILCGRELREAGRITAANRKAPAIERALSIAVQLHPLLGQVDQVMIEIPGGKTHVRERVKAIAGLPVYGMAVGIICMHLIFWASLADGKLKMWAIGDDQWTGSRPKANRARQIEYAFPKYDWSSDKGHDAADAIGVASFGLDRQSQGQAPGVPLHGLFGPAKVKS